MVNGSKITKNPGFHRQIDYEHELKRDLKNEVTVEVTTEAIKNMYDFGVPIETIYIKAKSPSLT